MTIRVEASDEGKNFSCGRSGNCCHHINVPLNCYDMERLIKVKPWEEWLDLIVMTKEEIKEFGAETIPVYIDGKMMLPVLQAKKNDDCYFFGRDEKGLGGCTIWLHRPRVCRTYPFESDEHGKPVFLQEAKDIGCWSEGMGLKPDAGYIKDLQLLDQESDLDEKITRAWNEKGSGKVPDFVPFVLDQMKQHHAKKK